VLRACLLSHTWSSLAQTRTLRVAPTRSCADWHATRVTSDRPSPGPGTPDREVPGVPVFFDLARQGVAGTRRPAAPPATALPQPPIAIWRWRPLSQRFGRTMIADVRVRPSAAERGLRGRRAPALRGFRRTRRTGFQRVTFGFRGSVQESAERMVETPFTIRHPTPRPASRPHGRRRPSPTPSWSPSVCSPPPWTGTTWRPTPPIVSSHRRDLPRARTAQP
jgi:hypothetical protein